MFELLLVLGTLLAALVLFFTGTWRYDVVALLALLVVTVFGIVPAEDAFLGFGHPAVVTVVAILIVSRGLANAGLVDALGAWIGKVGHGPGAHLVALTTAVAITSALMNNVGALALLMPVAIRLAREQGRSPSMYLMPLAFGSLLGGLMTLIGTPPNIIIAAVRADAGAEPFRMFDFAPVGVPVTLAGLVFLWITSSRLMVRRTGPTSREDLFDIPNYLTELSVPSTSKLVGSPIRDLGRRTKGDVVVVAVVRDGQRLAAPGAHDFIEAGDLLVVEADSAALDNLLETSRLELVPSKTLTEEMMTSEGIILSEAVVVEGSAMQGRTVKGLNLRRRFAVNLVAVARSGRRLKRRLGDTRFRAGDVLLLQGAPDALQQTISDLGCLPLAERALRFGKPRRMVAAAVTFGVAMLLAATGLLPVQVAFTAAAATMILLRLLSLSEAYESVEWPIIVLLGAMIPLGTALEDVGGAQLIGHGVIVVSAYLPEAGAVTILLVITMLLSNVVNNAAAAVLMAPVGIAIAAELGAPMDPFLMAVAVGSSVAFLTPIGHQSNTLVMGPGGYAFSDYWRIGLPLSVLVVGVAVPTILLVWGA